MPHKPAPVCAIGAASTPIRGGAAGRVGHHVVRWSACSSLYRAVSVGRWGRGGIAPTLGASHVRDLATVGAACVERTGETDAEPAATADSWDASQESAVARAWCSSKAAHARHSPGVIGAAGCEDR